jgi:hypothetical protein
VHKVLQMERRVHAMRGMDAVYLHVTDEMRQQLCGVLEQLWQGAVAQRYELAPRSAVPLLNEILITHERDSGGQACPSKCPPEWVKALFQTWNRGSDLRGARWT